MPSYRISINQVQCDVTEMSGCLIATNRTLSPLTIYIYSYKKQPVMYLMLQIRNHECINVYRVNTVIIHLTGMARSSISSIPAVVTSCEKPTMLCHK